MNNMLITKAPVSSLAGKLNQHFYAAILLTATSVINFSVSADEKIQDDLVVTGSLCAGQDCVNGESFGFDTLRLKENNLRIKFIDTSSSGSFPAGDWQIKINDSANGGADFFAIEDFDEGTTPFTISNSAPNNSLYIYPNGNVGFGTITPLVDVNIKGGNSPTVRLEQDTSSGFSEQIWDVGGNETNFFIRDVTHNGLLPFRIVPGAPNNALYIAADGDIGFETSTPDGLLDIAHPADANNHALLVSPTGDFGINVDNGKLPRGLLDVQTTGGLSQFLVQPDGKVAIGAGATTTTTNLFEVYSNGTSALNVDSTGNVTVANDLTVTGTLNMTLPGFSAIRTDLVEVSATAFKVAGTITATGKIIGSDVCNDAGDCVSDSGSGPSSRAIKDVISEINKDTVLDKVSNLYISRWSYKKDDNSIQHIGPMAEDFHEAFGLNGDVTNRISYVDSIGVALASVQALNQKLTNQLKIKDDEIQLLKNDIAEIKHMIKLQNSLHSK